MLSAWHICTTATDINISVQPGLLFPTTLLPYFDTYALQPLILSLQALETVTTPVLSTLLPSQEFYDT